MAGRRRTRRRLLRRRTPRLRGAVRRLLRNIRGRGRRRCRTAGYSFTAHKVPKRLRRRHRRGLPGSMRSGQLVVSRRRTRRRAYWLGTRCKPSGRLVTSWDRGARRRRRRSRR